MCDTPQLQTSYSLIYPNQTSPSYYPLNRKPSVSTALKLISCD